MIRFRMMVSARAAPVRFRTIRSREKGRGDSEGEGERAPPIVTRANRPRMRPLLTARAKSHSATDLTSPHPTSDYRRDSSAVISHKYACARMQVTFYWGSFCYGRRAFTSSRGRLLAPTCPAGALPHFRK
jgi:hypothetical protein